MKWLLFFLFLLEFEDGKVLGYQNDCTKFSIPSCVNGNVELVDGECKCKCEPEFTGDNCDIKDMCSDNPCHHGGECRVGPDGDYYCDCKYGYVTSNCMDRDPCLLEESHCLNGATCNRINDLDFTCACAVPYQGDHCETLNLCNLDQGECLDVSANDSISPLCFPCSENIPHENGCLHDETKGTYECKCLPGFTGELCDARKAETSLLSRITLPILNLEEMWPHNFIVHKLWIPYEKSKPLQTLMVAVNLTSEFRIHISIRQKYRPNCEDVAEHWEQILPTGSSNDKDMWIEDHTVGQDRGDIYRRIPYNMTYPVKTQNEKEIITVDFYMIFWPEATDSSEGGSRPVEVTFDYGIYVVNCTPQNSLNASDLVPDDDSYADCFAKPSNQTKGESQYKFLICECTGAPFDLIFPYLIPVEFKVEIYQPLELFKNSSFQYCHIIPWVVLGCTILYLLFLILFILSDCWKNRRPKLIVMTDVRKIAIETFYLLTIETGRGLCASSSATIGAQIYGTCYRTKPLVLSDHNVITTRQDDEDNFLFSTEKDLGEIVLIRLWHDNQGYSPNWYCRKVILKNIKSGQSWYFYVSAWLSVTYSTLVLSVQVASPQEVERHRRGKFCKVFKYQFRDRHIVLSPFLCTSRSIYRRSERWTVLFTTVFIYMFLLICFYGFPRDRDPGVILAYDNFAIVRPFVILYGLYVVLIGLPILIILDIIFRIWRRIGIPTLLVCGMGGLKSNEKPKRPPPPKNRDYNRWNNLDPNRIMVVGEPKEPTSSNINESGDEWAFMTDNDTEEPPLEDSLSTEAFQVPSTSISRTENWIGSYLTKTDFPVPVQKIQQPPEKPPYHKILKDGVVGAVTSIKDADPNRLVYKDKEDDQEEEKHVDEKIAREIRNSFSEPYWKWPDVESSPRGSKDPSHMPGGGGRKVVTIKDERPPKVSPEQTKKPQVIDQGSQTTFAYEDPAEVATKKEIESLKPVEKSSEIIYPMVELCETEEITNRGRCCPQWLLYLFLVICLLIMIACGIVTVFYGLRYGFYMSVNWCFSFFWALVFSFVAVEIIRIFIVTIILFCIRRRKTDIESFDEIKARRRFRLIWFREGPCDFPPKWSLKYILFFPTQVFMPLSSYRMFWLRTEERKRSRLCRNLIDITLFLIFIIGIIILSVYIRSVEYYNSNHNIGEIFKIHVDEKKMEHSFWGINSTEAFYGYLSETFLSQIQEGSTNMTQMHIWNHGYVHPISGFQWLKNEVAILLGPVRLRQHRVKEYPCEAVLIPKMLNDSMSCQREFVNTLLKKTYDEGDYYCGWKSSLTEIERAAEVAHFKIPALTSSQDFQLAFENAWQYRSSYDTESVSYHGFHSNYDGGGYTVLLNRNITISLELLKILHKEQWVDLRTRVIFIEFTTFNPNVDLYNVHVYAMERSGFSSWNMSTRTYTTRFPFVNEYGTSMDSGTLILILLVSFVMILLITYFFISSIYHIINACRLYGCKGLKHSWLWIDLVIALLSITCILIYIFSYEEAASKISIVAPDTKTFVNFQYAARLRQIYLYMLCVLLVTCYVKFWRLFILSNRRTYVVGFTLKLTRRLVFGSVICFVILLCAFASFYRLVFGLYDHKFTSFGQSVTNLIQVAKIGSAMSFRALSEYDEIFGPIFYLLYNGITYFLMINVLISVLTMGLQEAHDSARHRCFKHDYIYFIWSNMKKLIPRRLLKKRRHSTDKHEWEYIKHMRAIDPQRWHQMRSIIQQTLEDKLEADKVQKMREIKEFCNEDILPMYSRRTRIISKGEKFRNYKKHHMKIPQDRLDTMIALTREFLKKQTGHDFSADDIKTYHEFNLKVTQLKFETLEWKINTLGHLLGQITQSSEFEGSEWEIRSRTKKKDQGNPKNDKKDETEGVDGNIINPEDNDNNNQSKGNNPDNMI